MSSLLLRYKFNDPATFLIDSTGNSNTLTDVNGVESVSDPSYGTAASFSNSPTKYFSLAAAPASTTGSSPRTFSYWVKQVATDTYRIIHGQGNGGNELRLQFSGNRYDVNGGSGQSPNPAPAHGQWAHITFTYDGTTERTYFQGSLDRAVVVALSTTTGPLFIGSAPRYPTNYSLGGYMLDFRVYDGALSDAEINTLFTDGPNPGESIPPPVSLPDPLLWCWMSSSSIGEDSSGFGNDMSASNVALVDDAEKGNVASFDGSSSQLSLGSSLTEMRGTHPRTFAFWAKPNVPTNSHLTFFHTGSGGSYQRFRFDIYHNNITIVDIAAVNNLGTAQVPNDTWTRIAVTSDNTNINVYMNGVLDRSWTRTVNTGSNGFTIGMNKETNSQYYVGLMSDFRFYGSALTAQQVALEYSTSDQYIRKTGVFYDGVSVEWAPVDDATSYRVVVNDVVVVASTTETKHSARGYANGAVLNIQIQSSTDDATYTDIEYGYLGGITVQGEYSYLISNPANYPRPASAVSYLNPYDPAEYALRATNGLGATYNIATGAYAETIVSSYLEVRYNYQTRGMIGRLGTELVNLGQNARYLGLYPDQSMLREDHEFYNHSTSFRNFDVSFHGVIYFSTTTDEIWSVNIDGSNAQLLFSTSGTAGPIATDPHNPDTLVYLDGDDIKYRILSTGVTTDVIVGNMSRNVGIVVLNGVVYTNYFFKPGIGGYIRVNLDGVTNLYEYTPPQNYVWSFGFIVDTVNKTAYTLEDDEIFAHVDGSIADLPPDPAPVVDSGGGVTDLSLPVLHITMNTPSDLGNDSSVSGRHMRVLDVAEVDDPERGIVASFDDTLVSKLYLVLSDTPSEILGANPRTFTFWMRHQGVNTNLSCLFHTGSSAHGTRLMVLLRTDGLLQVDVSGQVNVCTLRAAQNEWHYVAVTTDGSEISVYMDGVLDTTWEKVIDTSTSRLTLGNSSEHTHYRYNGLMSDFRAYGTRWSDSDIADDYTSSIVFTATPGVISANIVIGEVENATAYRVTTQTDQGAEITALDGIQPTQRTQTVPGLVPETTYTMNVYVIVPPSADYELIGAKSVTTLVNTVENYDLVATDGAVDLTAVTDESKEFFSAVANDLLTTGESLVVTVANADGQAESLPSTFANLNTTVDVSNAQSVFAPFNSDNGAGQAITLLFADNSTQEVDYNDTNNSIIVEGVEYFVGDSFVSGGKRFLVQDF